MSGVKHKSGTKKRMYDVYTMGATKKPEVKVSVEAHSPQEAEKKGKMFSVVAGVTFLHTKPTTTK